ncbi:MAG: hypothetical protein WCX73_02065 [Candidatus Pacearchaeota archaeon]|jgi:uridine kinase
MEYLKIDSFLTDYSKHICNSYKIISIAGGSGSGKTWMAEQLTKKINAKTLKLDDYIIPETITPTSNWDIPSCWNLDLIEEHLTKFLAGKSFKKPIYNFKTGTNEQKEIITPDKKLIVEGLYALHPQLKKYSNLSMFMDIAKEERLNRVLKRDIIERGTKTKEQIIKRWKESIQPMYLVFVGVQKYKADIVLN